MRINMRRRENKRMSEREVKRRRQAYWREERRRRFDAEKKARNVVVVEKRGMEPPRELTRGEVFARIQADERVLQRLQMSRGMPL